MNNYNLYESQAQQGRKLRTSLKKLLYFLKEDALRVAFAILAAIINTGLNLIAPMLVGYVVDTYIQAHDFDGVLQYGFILLVIFIAALISNYFQTLLMGTVGQNILYRLRSAIFKKLQALPIVFFNQNKAGDLISRINNDTDKLNQFFSRSVISFFTNTLTIAGAAVFIVTLDWRLGLASLLPACVLLIFTQLISPWIKRKNDSNLKNEGGMSGEISESLDNFEVIVAFNRRDFFRKKFEEVNQKNYEAAIHAGVANNTLTPTYGLASNTAQLIVIIYGLALISEGSFTLGLLISFLLYINRLYDPLKQMAAVWSSFQTALAGWDRIYSILILTSNMKIMPSSVQMDSEAPVVEFQNVHFTYPEGKEVLKNISLSLQQGKTYAFVGPTGGGKTTTASLIARLFDPTEGTILLNGKDVRSYTQEERSQKVGFILQEPFLFQGTIKENIIMGNEKYAHHTTEQLHAVIQDHNLEAILNRFDEGLETNITTSGGSLSLGQKQLIAFMRAVLRNPDVLILDEATANIDTVTEKLLDEILMKLPKKTTRVIIAHRLNTIKNAAEIFFVNDGNIKKAGSMKHALNMLLHGERTS